MSDKLVNPPDELDLFIEWPEKQGVVQAGIGDNLEGLKAESQKAINITLGVIRSMAYRITKTIDDLKYNTRPDEVEVEFSLKLDLEGGVIIPMVAKTTAGGQFNIKFLWKLDKPQRTSVLVSENK